jgi:hypothetical protein
MRTFQMRAFQMELHGPRAGVTGDIRGDGAVASLLRTSLRVSGRKHEPYSVQAHMHTVEWTRPRDSSGK